MVVLTLPLKNYAQLIMPISFNNDLISSSYLNFVNLYFVLTLPFPVQTSVLIMKTHLIEKCQYKRASGQSYFAWLAQQKHQVAVMSHHLPQCKPMF